MVAVAGCACCRHLSCRGVCQPLPCPWLHCTSERRCSSPPRVQSQQEHDPGDRQMNLLVEDCPRVVDEHGLCPPTQLETGS